MAKLNRDLLVNKIILVTGSTDGIGKETATALASLGAEIIVHGRNPEKTQKTVREIKDLSNNEQISYLIADFTDLNQIREMATELQEKYSRLDVLINNAGVYNSRRIDTDTGVERTFLINHLAPFTLTNLLLPILKASAPSRIVNVSSQVHSMGRLDFEDLGFKKGYFGMMAYSRSKLANMLFTYELDRRLKGSGVTVNGLHPGHVATNIWGDAAPLIGSAVKRLMKWISLSPEEGADNSIYLASSADLDNISGQYFMKREPVRSSTRSYDRETAARLWQVSEELTEITSKS
jgi:NAD(P)-dependent dehydrogenase (short-subunit alcohol dehydrogenase family)